MKRHTSILALTARSSLFFALAIALVMAAAEIFLFRMALDGALAGVAESYAQHQAEVEFLASLGMKAYDSRVFSLDSLDNVLGSGRILWVWRAALVLLTVQLCRVGCEFGAKPGYTLRRLELSERRVVLWQAVGNALFYVFLWAVQLALALVFCKVYADTAADCVSLPEALRGQLMFQSFCQIPFLHGLLPLEDIMAHLANLVAVASLSLTAAAWPFQQRHGGFGGELIPVLGALLWYFARELNSSSNWPLLVILLFCAACAALRVKNHEEVDEDEAERPAEEVPQA